MNAPKMAPQAQLVNFLPESCQVPLKLLFLPLEVLDVFHLGETKSRE